MFKSLGNFIYRIPWWGLILGGLFMLAALVMFATPIQLLRLSDSGATPAEKSAIKREINLAFGDRALNIAEAVVGRMKERSTDPDRVRELNHALAEMARAREELTRAQAGVAIDSAQEANDAALETAMAAAESALESATDAREGIEEARDEAAQKLREKGVAATLSPETRNDIRAKVAGDVWRIGVGSALILVFIPLFIMLLIAKYFIGRSRRALAFAEEKKQEAKVSDVSRQITEARLQALQAQVEPHFLYNTLANVQALTEVDPPAANTMVGHLIQYLRAALPKMRESTSTIGQEVELVTAYLNILKMRMGARLEFGIDVPADLLTKSLPPMMLPSLVENAIKHGLEPLREGGRIDVVATRVITAGGERIRLQVKDTGKGLSDAPVQAGGGVGLANLRERLSALYGDDARFTLESNAPHGVIATIEVPAEVPSTTFAAAGAPAADPASAAPPPSAGAIAPNGWRRAWRATSKTHSVWAWIVSRLFFGLMLVLGAAFVLALIGLYTGWLPVDFGDWRLDGVEGLAVGSILLLVGFVASAVAIAVVVAVFYGLGFLFAALLILIPAIVLISLFPVLSPFILIGLAIYWFWWKRRKDARKTDAV